MAENEKRRKSEKELRKLREELWVILPFFIMSFYFFLGSFQYKRGASYVPMIIGAATALLAGLRLYHIIFPHSRIGDFREAGLAGQFDQLKEEIEEEALKGHIEEVKKEITFADERKAFFALIGCFFIFLFFGYIVGSLLLVLLTCLYYGYREKLPIAITLILIFIIVYVVLYKILEAPADFGLLLEPLLNYFHLI